MHETHVLVTIYYIRSPNLKLLACYSIYIQNTKERKKTCIVAAALDDVVGFVLLLAYACRANGALCLS